MYFLDASDLSADWLKNLAIFICSGAAVYAAFKKQPTPAKMPQPLEVKPAAEYATASGVQAIASRVTLLDNDVSAFKTAIVTQINGIKDEIGRQGEQRAVRINERIDDLVLAIGELRGSDKAHGSQIESLVQTIVHRRAARGASAT